MTINERIREFRKYEGLTLEKFGEKVGLKKGSLSAVEVGTNAVTERLIMMIVREFGVSEDWLRNGSGEMFPPPSDRDRLAALADSVLKNRDDTERQFIVDFLYNQINDDELHLIIDKVSRFVDGIREAKGSQD